MIGFPPILLEISDKKDGTFKFTYYWRYSADMHTHIHILFQPLECLQWRAERGAKGALAPGIQLRGGIQLNGKI